MRKLSNAFGRHGLTSTGAFERSVFVTVLASVVLEAVALEAVALEAVALEAVVLEAVVLGLGVGSGFRGLGAATATFLALASSRLPLTVLLGSFAMTGAESACGARATNEVG